jgi:hypothetical protein
VIAIEHSNPELDGSPARDRDMMLTTLASYKQ